MKAVSAFPCSRRESGLGPTRIARGGRSVIAHADEVTVFAVGAVRRRDAPGATWQTP